MRCEPLEVWEEALDGEIDAWRVPSLDRHLSACERCSSWVATLRREKAQFHSLISTEPVPESILRGVEARISPPFGSFVLLSPSDGPADRPRSDTPLRRPLSPLQRGIAALRRALGSRQRPSTPRPHEEDVLSWQPGDVAASHRPATAPRQPGYSRSAPRLSRRHALVLTASVGALMIAVALRRSVEDDPRWKAPLTPLGVCRVTYGRNSPPAPLRPGERVRTDARREATLVDGFGVFKVRPNSSLRLLQNDAGRMRFELKGGIVEAHVRASPGVVSFETPSATVVDLGCSYRLAVTVDTTSLEVVSGRVMLKRGPREAVVPAGWACFARRGGQPSALDGPGAPFRLNSSAAFRAALDYFETPSGSRDLGPGAHFWVQTEDRRRAALSTLLSAARPQDAATLSFLLGRLEPKERALATARMAQLVSPPPGVSPKKVAASDARQLAAWRERMQSDGASAR